MPKRGKKLKHDPATLVQSFSKNLLGLKFMQRAQKIRNDTTDDDEDEDDNRSTHLDTSKIQKLNSKQKCIMNPSYQSCEGLRFGRLSFKGMNLDIELIMQKSSSESDNNHRSNNLGSSIDPARGGGSRGEKRPASDDWDDEEEED